MNKLILELERLTDESKSIANLLVAIESAAETEALDNFKDGICFLAMASVKNNMELERVWKELYQISKKSK